MEVVLLWLDDLEDWVFVSLTVWLRRRLTCLRFGLLFALMIPLTGTSSDGSDPDLLFFGVASASVGLWLLALLAPRFGARARIGVAHSA